MKSEAVDAGICLYPNTVVFVLRIVVINDDLFSGSQGTNSSSQGRVLTDLNGCNDHSMTAFNSSNDAGETTDAPQVAHTGESLNQPILNRILCNIVECW